MWVVVFPLGGGGGGGGHPVPLEPPRLMRFMFLLRKGTWNPLVRTEHRIRTCNLPLLKGTPLPIGPPRHAPLLLAAFSQGAPGRVPTYLYLPAVARDCCTPASLYPRQDSNLQKPEPKSGASPIAPRRLVVVPLAISYCTSCRRRGQPSLVSSCALPYALLLYFRCHMRDMRNGTAQAACCAVHDSHEPEALVSLIDHCS